MMMVTMPTPGRNPTARPIMCSCCSHRLPLLNNCLSFPGLLSPCKRAQMPHTAVVLAHTLGPCMGHGRRLSVWSVDHQSQMHGAHYLLDGSHWPASMRRRNCQPRLERRGETRVMTRASATCSKSVTIALCRISTPLCLCYRAHDMLVQQLCLM